MSLSTLVGGLSDLGLTALGLRELSLRDRASRTQLMRSLIGLRVAVSSAGVAVVVGFAALAGYGPTLVAGVAIAGGGVVVQSLQSTLSLSLMWQLRLGWVTALEVGRQALIAVLIVAVVELDGSLLVLLALAIPAGVVTLVLTAMRTRGDAPLMPTFHLRELRKLVRKVLPFSIAAALGVIYFRVSVIAVSLITGARELGYFSTSFRILEVLVGIPGLMVAAAFPVFARSAVTDHDRFAYAVGRVFEVALIAGGLFALVVGLGAPIAIDVVGGARFHPAIEVLEIQAVGLGGSFVSAVWGMALLSLDRQRETIILTGAALFVGTTLVAVLASLLGSRGAAVGTAATELLLAAAGPLFLARAGRHLIPSMRCLPRILFAVAVAAAPALVPGLVPIARVLLSAVIYILALLALGAVPVEILNELRGLRTRLHPGI